MNSSMTIQVYLKPGTTTGRVTRLLARAPFIAGLEVINVVTPHTLLDPGGHVQVIDRRLCRKCDSHHGTAAPCVTT